MRLRAVGSGRCTDGERPRIRFTGAPVRSSPIPVAGRPTRARLAGCRRNTCGNSVIAKPERVTRGRPSPTRWSPRRRTRVRGIGGKQDRPRHPIHPSRTGRSGARVQTDRRGSDAGADCPARLFRPDEPSGRDDRVQLRRQVSSTPSRGRTRGPSSAAPLARGALAALIWTARFRVAPLQRGRVHPERRDPDEGHPDPEVDRRG
jgi:hypothetical protein